jgi:DNA-binding NarL/FixJ family response regulator
LDATRQIAPLDPTVKVLILTVTDAPQSAKQVLAAGARGYVLKSDMGSELLRAVHAVASGQFFLTNRASEIIVCDIVQNDRPAPNSVILTDRESLLVQLLFDGKSNKEIAAELGISVRTVETHRKNIMAKLGVHSLGELFRYAIRTQIVHV